VEKSAPRLGERAAKKPDVVQQLKELMTRAEKLRAQLFSSHYWAEEYRPDGPPMTLDSRLRSELAAICDVDEDSVADDFSLLRFSLGATVGSCDNILKKLRSDNFGYKDGETWNIWIALVTLILKFNDLPFGTRKDVYRVLKNQAKESEPSPFVKLIKYLHGRALKGDQRFHTDGGLAKAIDRARASVNTSNIKRDDVEPQLFRLLGAKKSPKVRLDEMTPTQEMVDLVRAGARVGVHPVVPEPLREATLQPQTSRPL
jgi:hypothetical protein